jgi:Holliday junction resolvase
MDEIKKRLNSNKKGSRGEREFRDLCKKNGFTAERTCQRSGKAIVGSETLKSDVICYELPDIHFEVKYRESMNPFIAMQQAVTDCQSRTPVVVWKKNKQGFLIIMRPEDWFKIIKETHYTTLVFCKKCKSTNIRKRGFTSKRRQKYECLNEACDMHMFSIE